MVSSSSGAWPILDSSFGSSTLCHDNPSWKVEFESSNDMKGEGSGSSTETRTTDTSHDEGGGTTLLRWEEAREADVQCRSESILEDTTTTDEDST